MKKVKYALNIWRLLPAYVWLTSSKTKRLKNDFKRWKKIYGKESESDFLFMAFALLELKEFRNLFEYRLRKSGRSIAKVIFKILFPLYDTLFINANDIEEGFFIQHGFATIITADHIGKNCFINQQVTIGANKLDDKIPFIGDDVRICAGAIVIGDIKIGNRAVIGAGSVVVSDVNENEVVAGVPAKVIRIRA